MKVMSFLLNPPALAGFIGASGKNASAAGRGEPAVPSSSFLERLDRWFWRQQLRERFDDAKILVCCRSQK